MGAFVVIGIPSPVASDLQIDRGDGFANDQFKVLKETDR
jgi:hypothetical protein